jgi:hypothetical protein
LTFGFSDSLHYSVIIGAVGEIVRSLGKAFREVEESKKFSNFIQIRGFYLWYFKKENVAV